MTDRETITLTSALPATPPERLRLFKRGPNETLKGTFVFDDESASSIMKAFASHGAEIPFDFDHAMVQGAAPTERIAAGWFVPEIIDGELWATGIRWTPRAAEQIANREWRYISPAFLVSRGEGARRIVALTNVALTNLPATVGMEPIAAHASGAEEIHEMNDQNTAGELVALTGAPTAAEASAIVLSWKAAHERLPAIEKELAEIHVARNRERFDAVIASALGDGRLTPAKGKELEAVYASEGLQAVERIVSFLPTPSATKVDPVSTESVALSADDRAEMAKYGISEAAMLAARKAG